MTCEDLQQLRSIHTRLATSPELGNKEAREAFYSLNAAMQKLRWLHDDTGCLCWYRQLRAEGKYIIPEIAVRLETSTAA
jgi:hypothetical protein